MRTVLRTIIGLSVTLLSISSLAAQDRVPWQNDPRQAMQLASQRGQLVLIHFYGDNCPPCLWMENHVFNRPEVIRSITTGYVALKVNCDQRSDLADRYGIETIPTDVIITADGREVHRNGGAQAANKYIAYLDQIVANYRVGQNSAVAGAQPTGRSATPQAGNAPQPGTYMQPGYSNPPQSNPEYQVSTGNTVPSDPNSTRKSSDFQPPARSEFAANSGPANSGPANSGAANPTGGTAATFTGNRYSNPYVTSNQPQETLVSAETGPGLNLPASNASSGIPAGSPPLIMGGFCPITIMEGNAWQQGDHRFGAIHRGRTYLFAGESQREKFMTAPDTYAPALAGYDAIRYLESGELVEGKADYGLICEDRIFLFADKEGQERFASAARNYLERVRDAERSSDPGTN